MTHGERRMSRVNGRVVAVVAMTSHAIEDRRDLAALMKPEVCPQGRMVVHGSGRDVAEVGGRVLPGVPEGGVVGPAHRGVHEL